MKDKIIEILKSKIRIKSTVMTDYCDPHIKSDITGFEEAAQEISALLKGEGEYYQKVYIKSEADLPKIGQTYVVFSKSFGLHHKDLDEYNKNIWLKAIEYYLQPVSLPDKDGILEEYTVRYLKSEHDTQIEKMTKIFGKKPDVFEQGVNTLIAIVEGKVNNPCNNKDAIIQKQDELIQNFKDWCKAKSIHDEELALEISKDANRLESELENLKKQ